MKTKKIKSKISFFKLFIPIMTLSSTALILSSCAAQNSTDNDIQKKLENEVSKIDHSDVALKQDTFTLEEFNEISEENILEKIQNVDYDNTFKYKVTEFSKGEDTVSFKLEVSVDKYKKETKLITLKCNIKDVDSENQTLFDKAYASFNLKVKAGKDISKIDASGITTEQKLLEVFDLVIDKEQITHKFVSVEKIATTKINITYKLTSVKDNKITENKSLTLSGFLNQNTELQKKFDELYTKFNVSLKNSVSNIEASAIKDEKTLKQYFNVTTIEGLTSEFVLSKVSPSNKTTLIVEYKLSLSTNNEIMKKKSFSFSGFKRPITDQEIFDQSYNSFKLQVKSGKDISQILASTINNEDKINEYFNVIVENNINNRFISANVNPNNKKSIDVVYELSLKNNGLLKRQKTLTIVGFKEPELSKNEKLLQEALSKVTATLNHDVSQISARDFITNGWTYKDYIEVNVQEVEDIDPSLIKVNDTYKNDRRRDENSTTSIIVVVTIEVGKEDSADYSIGKREFIINGFKSLITGLDAAPINQILTPIDAVSYKNKLEPLAPLTNISKSAYTDKLTQFTWEQYKKEIMFQLRFWMYQMFSDNFSEINYWVKEDKNNEYKTKFTIEGIVKENVNNLHFWIQQIGSTAQATRNLVKGQKIQINFWFNSKTSNDQSWKPTGVIEFEHGLGSGIKGFSFQKGMSGYIGNATNYPLKVTQHAIVSQLTTLIKCSIEVKFNNEIVISNYNWAQVNSFLFTIGRIIERLRN